MTEPGPDDPNPLRVDLDRLGTYSGQTLGRSSWHEITQEKVNQFADATGDHQWIHVDPVRAKDGPFGGAIGHGYLTLSMAPVLLLEVLSVNDIALVVNCGANRVRFASPALVGSRLRATVDLLEVKGVDGGVQAAFRMAFERDDTKLVCLAEIVFRFYRSEREESAAPSTLITGT